jgi:hypothetical protein
MIPRTTSCCIVLIAFFTVAAFAKSKQNDPSVSCILKKDKHCVTWAVWHFSSMSQEEILAVADMCEQKCGDVGRTCEVSIESDEALRYYCGSAVGKTEL